MTDSRSQRVTSIDVLRGVIVVLMALDHTREFFHFPVDPTNLSRTTVTLFATRWVTHFCAPVFMALAGVGAYLNLSSGKTTAGLSRFLVTRGVFLVVLEVTVVRLGWFFNVDYHLVELLVIAALGWSMVVLAGMIWLPRRVLATLCVTVIVGHHALDGIQAAGQFGWVWRLLHAPGQIVPAPGYVIGVGYVLIPWAFVMALGFCCGPIFRWTPAARRRALIWTGAMLTLAFVVIRGINGYGDSNHWTAQRTLTFTVLSFLNCQKYPPSLCYLLMTLGPACLALAMIESWTRGIGQIFLALGRVPLFFYVLHLPTIHLTAAVFALVRYGHAEFMLENPSPNDPTPFPAPPGYGYSLWVVYLVWIAIITVLYPACRWFFAYKRAHRAAWLSYV